MNVEARVALSVGECGSTGGTVSVWHCQCVTVEARVALCVTVEPQVALCVTVEAGVALCVTVEVCESIAVFKHTEGVQLFFSDYM